MKKTGNGYRKWEGDELKHEMKETGIRSRGEMKR
jgi:hypothetical protein